MQRNSWARHFLLRLLSVQASWANASQWRCGARSTREYNRHGCGSHRSYSYVRPDLGSALESCRYIGRRHGERPSLGASITVCIGADPRRCDRSRRRTSDIWHSTHFPLTAYSKRPGSISERVHPDFGPAFGNVGMLARSFERCTLRCGSLHHRCVLVHGVDILRQPCRNDCEVAQRHVCRHSANRCPPLHLCPNRCHS